MAATFGCLVVSRTQDLVVAHSRSEGTISLHRRIEKEEFALKCDPEALLEGSVYDIELVCAIADQFDDDLHLMQHLPVRIARAVMIRNVPVVPSWFSDG